MENREPTLQHYPTTAELYAFERAARQARAAAMARLARRAVSNVKKLFSSGEAKGLRHA
jgi:hypothetical protein